MIKIDARQQECPAPVLMAKDTLEKRQPNSLEIVVDNEAAKENVTRFLESREYIVSIKQNGEAFSVIGKRGKEALHVTSSTERGDSEQRRIMVMIATDRMGSGDDELGIKLMINFIKTLKEMGSELWRLVFVNAGVKHTVHGSETLKTLRELERDGLHVLVCGTCLNHFGLMRRKEVGITTNMLDIVMAMQFADKIINL